MEPVIRACSMIMSCRWRGILRNPCLSQLSIIATTSFSFMPVLIYRNWRVVNLSNIVY